MASPLAISLNAPTELSKSVETLIGSYFDAACCGITGYRDNMEDAHTMLSFSLNGKQTVSPTTLQQQQQQPDAGSLNAENPFLSPSGFLGASTALVSSINKNYSCFCIFDGHASNECAQYMAKNLPLAIQKTMEDFSEKTMKKTSSQQQLLFENESSRQQLAADIKKTFTKIDHEFLNEVLADDPGNNHCETFGTTAVVVIVEPITGSGMMSSSTDVSSNPSPSTDQTSTSPASTTSKNKPLVGRAMVCNLGDSRCLVMRDGKAVFTTIDQKPNDKEERERIEKAGEEFYVEVAPNGIHRISGTISVARAFGDKPFKPFQDPARDPVSSTPVIDFVDLLLDDVLLLGCDGLFEGAMFDQDNLLAHLSARMSQAVARLQHKMLAKAAKQTSGCGGLQKEISGELITSGRGGGGGLGATTKMSGLPFVTLSTICAELCHKACNGGSKDNISSMLIRMSKDHLLVNNAHGNTRRRSSTNLNGSPQPLHHTQRRRSTTNAGSLAPPPELLAKFNSNNDQQQQPSLNVELPSGGEKPQPKPAARRRAKSVMANHPDQRNNRSVTIFTGSSRNLKAEAEKQQQQETDSSKNNNTTLQIPGLQVETNLQVENNNTVKSSNQQVKPPHRPLSSKPLGKGHGRSHSSNNHNILQHNSGATSKSSTQFGSTGFGSTSMICDPLLLINKLQTKFIAGPLPEYDKTWHIFKRMAEEHGADAKAAAKKRLRMLRVANEVMADAAKNSMNTHQNNNDPSSLTISTTPAKNATTTSPDLASTADVTSPLGGPPSLQSQFSRTMLPPNMGSDSNNNLNNNTSNTLVRTDLNFGNQITTTSNEWLQQYAHTLIQSGEYTEEDVALLTCEQTSLQLASEYHRMLAILIQQHQMAANNNNQASSASTNSGSSKNETGSNSTNPFTGSGAIDSAKLTAETTDDQWIDYYLNYVVETSMVSQRRANLGSLAQREFDASFGGSASGTNPFKAFVSMAPHHSVASSQSNQNNTFSTGGAAGGAGTNLSWSCTNAQDAVLQLISQQNDDDDDDYFDEDEEGLEDDNVGGGFYGGDSDGFDDDDDDDALGGGDDDDDSDGELNMTVRRS